MLATLPGAHELYQQHQVPNEPEQLCEGSEDEDPFGHSGAGLFDGEEHSPPPVLLPVKQDGHEWVWKERGWRCKNCFQRTTNRAEHNRSCEGMPSSIEQALQQAVQRKHRLRAAQSDSGVWTMWCVKCGCWSETKAIGLNRQCNNKPSRQGQTVLNRLARGRNPEGKPEAMSPGLAFRPV